MTHAMADSETLGTEPGCAVLSIGAVIFDPRGKCYAEPFYRNIDLTSSVMLGFNINADTVEWWKKQDPQAQADLSVNTAPIKEVLAAFEKWCIDNKVDRLWCHGATFDGPIIGKAFEIAGMKAPWRYTQVRDTRTIFDMFDIDLTKIPRVGVHHNALDDAIFQVNAVQEAFLKHENLRSLFTKTSSVADRALINEGRMRKALEKLSCLGNGEIPGNSEGNVIAQTALKELV